jgi:hypothetical protein
VEGINSGERNRQYAEKEGKFPGIRFEPWAHGDELRPGFHSVVLRRLREYNPQFLALDSDFPGIANPLIPTGGSVLNRLASPQDINTKDEQLFVVKGDMLLSGMGQSVGAEDKKFWLDNGVYDALAKKDSGYNADQSVTWLAKAGATIGLGALIYWLSNKSGEELLKSNLSRRKFLQLGIRGAGMAALASTSVGVFSPLLEAFTPNETTKDIVREVSHILTPEFVHAGWWVNGRTALVTAKMQDALDYMKKPHDTPAAVVMGKAHNYNSDLYLNNRLARQGAIHDLTKNTLNTCIEVFKNKGMPEAQRTIATNLFLDYVAATDIISFPLKGVDTPRKEALFLSPQVLEAIKDLRPVGQSG